MHRNSAAPMHRNSAARRTAAPQLRCTWNRCTATPLHIAPPSFSDPITTKQTLNLYLCAKSAQNLLKKRKLKVSLNEIIRVKLSEQFIGKKTERKASNSKIMLPWTQTTWVVKCWNFNSNEMKWNNWKGPPISMLFRMFWPADSNVKHNYLAWSQVNQVRSLHKIFKIYPIQWFSQREASKRQGSRAFSLILSEHFISFELKFQHFTTQGSLSPKEALFWNWMLFFGFFSE